MASSPASAGIRHSVLDLAPLELDCMNALWRLGEATVRDVRQALSPTRPRAYTTIMTILDRLAHKGVIQRRKTGRAWMYWPNVSEEQARSRAISQLVDGFFEGSAEVLASHLSSQRAALPPDGFRGAGGVASASSSAPSRASSSVSQSGRARGRVQAPEPEPKPASSIGLETTLL